MVRMVRIRAPNAHVLVDGVAYAPHRWAAFNAHVCLAHVHSKPHFTMSRMFAMA